MGAWDQWMLLFSVGMMVVQLGTTMSGVRRTATTIEKIWQRLDDELTRREVEEIEEEFGG